MPLSSFNWCVFGREEYLDTRKTGALLPVLCARSNTRVGFAAGVLHYHVARHLFNRDAHSFAEGDYVLRILDPQQFRGDYPFTVASRRQVDEGPAIPALSVEAPKSAVGLTEADNFLLEVADSCGFRQFEPNSNADITALRNEADEVNAAGVDMYVATGPQVVALIKRIEKGRDQPTLTQQDLVNEAMGLVDAMPEGPAKTWIKECHSDDLYVNVARQLFGTCPTAAKHPFGAANSHIKTYGQAWATARESEIAKLRGLLFAARNENADLRNDVALAQTHQMTAEAKLTDATNESANLRNQMAMLTDSQIEVARLLVTANAKATTAQAEISRLTDRLNAAERDTDNYRATAGNWRERATQAEARLTASYEGRKQDGKLLDQANERIAVLEAMSPTETEAWALAAARAGEIIRLNDRIAEECNAVSNANSLLSETRGRLESAEFACKASELAAYNWKDRAKKAEAALNDAEQGLGKMTVDLTRANERIADFEAMQPHWAKGYSSDGVAAQVTCVALNQLWELLGVKNQTEAMAALRVIMKDVRS